MTKYILLALSLLLPLGYAHAANDNANKGKGKGGSNMSMRELQSATDADLVAAYGNDKAAEVRAIVNEMKEHQRALAQLRKQLAQTTGNKDLNKGPGDKARKGKPDSDDDDMKGKGKNKDKGKGKNKDKDKSDEDDD